MAVIRIWGLAHQPWIAPMALATKVVRTIASQTQLLMDRAQETNSETVEMPWVHRGRIFDEIAGYPHLVPGDHRVVGAPDHDAAGGRG